MAPRPRLSSALLAACVALPLIATAAASGFYESAEATKGLVAGWDANDDGLVSVAEANTGLSELIGADAAAEKGRAASGECGEGDELVEAFDANGDGSLAGNEAELAGSAVGACLAARTHGVACVADVVVQVDGKQEYSCRPPHDEEEEAASHAEEAHDEHGHDEHAEESVPKVAVKADHEEQEVWECKEMEKEAPENAHADGERIGHGVAAVLVVTIVALGGIFIANKNFSQTASDRFGAVAVGALLAAVFLHMLPEAAHGDPSGTFSWRVGLAVLGGVLTAYAIEHSMMAIKASKLDAAVAAGLDTGAAGRLHSHGHSHPHDHHHDSNSAGGDGEEDESGKGPVTTLAEGSSPPGDEVVTVEDGTVGNPAATEVEAAPAAEPTASPDDDADADAESTSVVAMDTATKSEVVQKPKSVLELAVSVKSVVHTVIVGDFVHNLVDGLLIGTAFSGCSLSVGWAVTLAVVLHEVPTELTDFIILRRAGLTVKQALGANLISAASCFIGLFVALAVGTVSEAVNSTLLAFSSGILIFLAAADIMPELVECHSPSFAHVTLPVFLIALGMLIVGLTTLHDEHCTGGGGGAQDAHGH